MASAFFGLGRVHVVHVGFIHTAASQLQSVFMGCQLFYNPVSFFAGVSVPTGPFTVESLADP